MATVTLKSAYLTHASTEETGEPVTTPACSTESFDRAVPAAIQQFLGRGCQEQNDVLYHLRQSLVEAGLLVALPPGAQREAANQQIQESLLRLQRSGRLYFTQCWRFSTPNSVLNEVC